LYGNAEFKKQDNWESLNFTKIDWYSPWTCAVLNEWPANYEHIKFKVPKNFMVSLVDEKLIEKVASLKEEPVIEENPFE
jgi:hypothetical protein